MRITVLQGSPNRKGSTAILAKAFARGARDNGHEVNIIEVARVEIQPCTGCVTCGYGGPCVLHDDFDEVRKHILGSDMLVFATPLYYYGMTAQLKACIDRFCSANPCITGRQLDSAMLAVAWNSDDWTFEALEAHYDTLVKYLNMHDRGRVLGYGCGTPSMTRHSRYLQAAYDLGASL